MSTSRKQSQRQRPAPHLLNNRVRHLPVLPPPNQTSLRPTVPAHPTDVTLPMPSSHLYHDNYHHPWFPAVFPPINRFVTPEQHPYRFPQPLGPLQAHNYNLLGVQLHDYGYVNGHPWKPFTKWLLWYLEISDHLLRSICPADLNDMPCEWDELQGGCPMLRLCSARMKYEHPHLGHLPRCTAATRYNCMYIHDVEPTCRSIAKQLALLAVERDPQFRSWQRCEVVAKGDVCWWGHDFESARVVSVYSYWSHWAEARAQGSVGIIKKARDGTKVWKPIKPRAAEAGVTFHGLKLDRYVQRCGQHWFGEAIIRQHRTTYAVPKDSPSHDEIGHDKSKGRFPDSGYTSEDA